MSFARKASIDIGRRKVNNEARINLIFMRSLIILASLSLIPLIGLALGASDNMSKMAGIGWRNDRIKSKCAQ
jgi:hypothetical protein